MGLADGVGVPLVVTDPRRVDEGAVADYQMDLAFGDSEQSFEVTLGAPRLGGGAYVYIDGTEYGGIVDGIKADTTSTAGITYVGRTWHGILAGKIVSPPKGADYRTFAGDANRAVADIISHVGLSSLFHVADAASGIHVDYQYARYIDAYTALKDMLASAGAVLCMRRIAGRVECWAEPAATIDGQVDSDLVDFESESRTLVTNHLVCLGEGELAARTVVHLYADADGNVSQRRTFSGVDEIAEVYDYSSADRAKLIEDGTKKLKDMQSAGSIEVDVHGARDWRIGDWVTGRNNQVGTVVTSQVTKKIVKVQRGVMTVQYEMGEAAGSEAAPAERWDGAAIAAAAWAAGNALNEAGEKRRVFYGTPTPPYDVGDLWYDGDCLRICTTAKEA
jgi:hypothetical protein